MKTFIVATKGHLSFLSRLFWPLFREYSICLRHGPLSASADKLTGSWSDFYRRLRFYRIPEEHQGFNGCFRERQNCQSHVIIQRVMFHQATWYKFYCHLSITSPISIKLSITNSGLFVINFPLFANLRCRAKCVRHFSRAYAKTISSSLSHAIRLFAKLFYVLFK